MRGAPGMRALTSAQQQAAKAEIKAGGQKFKPGKDPIELESALTAIQPQTQAQAESVKTLLDRMRQAASANGDNAALSAIEMWQTNYEMDAANDQIRLAFMRDWWYWLLGRGSDADTARTPWGRANVAALNDEVAAYVETFIAKRLEWALKLVALRERVPRTLNEYYLFYKYIVRGNIIRKTDDNGTEYFDFNNEDFLQDWELMFRQFETLEQAQEPHVADSLTRRPDGEPAFDGHMPYTAKAAPDFLDKIYETFEKTLTERFEKRVEAEVRHEHQQRMSRAQRLLTPGDLAVYQRGEAELRKHADDEYDITGADDMHIDDLIEEVGEMARVRRRIAEEVAKEEIAGAKETVAELRIESVDRAKQLKSDMGKIPAASVVEVAESHYDELDSMLREIDEARNIAKEQARNAIIEKFTALGERDPEKLQREINRNTDKIDADVVRARKQIERMRGDIRSKVDKVLAKEVSEREKFEESLDAHEGVLFARVLGDDSFQAMGDSDQRWDREIHRLQAAMTDLFAQLPHKTKEETIEAMDHNMDLTEWKEKQRARLDAISAKLQEEVNKRISELEAQREEQLAADAVAKAQLAAEAEAAAEAAEAEAEFEKQATEQMGAAIEEAVEVEMREAAEAAKEEADKMFELLPEDQAQAAMDITDDIVDEIVDAALDAVPTPPPGTQIPAEGPTLAGFAIPEPRELTEAQKAAVAKRARENGDDEGDTKKTKPGTVEDKLEEVKELVEATQETVMAIDREDKRRREEEEIPKGETQTAGTGQRATVKTPEEVEKAKVPGKRKKKGDDE